MRIFKQRDRRAGRSTGVRVAVAGAAAMVAALTVGGGIAGAVGTGSAAVDAPSAGAPHYNQNPASEIIRGSGSDTTFFVMQKISDIYNAAGLYGCTLTAGGTGETLFDGTATSGSEPANHDCQAAATRSPSTRAAPTSRPPTRPTTGTAPRSSRA